MKDLGVARAAVSQLQAGKEPLAWQIEAIEAALKEEGVTAESLGTNLPEVEGWRRQGLELSARSCLSLVRERGIRTHTVLAVLEAALRAGISLGYSAEDLQLWRTDASLQTGYTGRPPEKE